MKLQAFALGLAMSIPLANAYTGDLTHYTPGLGSCGITNQNGDAIVAISIILMNNGQNPNINPVCNKQISIHNPNTGTNTTATITDSCKGCAADDIDVPPALFSIIAPTGDGRVHGIEWTPIGDWTFSGGSGESAPAQPSSVAVAPIPSAAVPTLALQEKVAAVVPLAAGAAPSESSSPPAALSVPAAAPSAVSPSAAQQPPSAPTSSTTSCTIAGQTVCSADGMQIGTCTMELTVQLGPVAAGTKCVGGYLVMANSRLRSRRG